MSMSRARRRTSLTVVAAGLLLTAGAVAVTAAPAAAATPAFVWTEQDHVHFTAAADDTANNVTITDYGFGGFAIQDAGGPISLDLTRAGACIRLDTNRIGCPTRSMGASFHLGHGDDTFVGWRDGVNLEVHVHGGTGRDSISGGAAVDHLYGDGGDDSIWGGGGGDFIYGGDHIDQIYGGAGADTIDGEAGADSVSGGDDGDLLINASRSRDSLSGDAGDDVIQGADFVRAGPGDDVIWMRAGFGEYYGDAGYDTIDYSYWPYPTLTMSLDGNDNDGAPGAKQNVHGDFERVVGSPGPDRIQGNGEADLIEGRGGNDILLGHGGNDVLDAGPGQAQQTIGGDGWDTCRGTDVVNRRGCDAS
ncbi:MAG TPA: calcium-binding protein [Catenuloplanes sp.]